MRTLKAALVNFAVDHPRWVALGLLASIVFFATFFPNMTMDTDPENMLETTEPARVFHNAAKKRFDLSDTIVVGVIKDNDPNGVFNPRTLAHVSELTRFATTLRYEDPKQPGKTTGVIEVDMVAPSVVDHLRQAGPGTIAFEWLMPRAPATQAEALAIRDKAMSNPLLVGQMVSADGKALCLYLPLTDKLLSYDVYTALQGKIREFGGTEDWHIAGLPVAEGAIGVEMFSEMVVASPLTMALIFGMLYAMFRKWSLVVLPMLIATATVAATLGAMIALGFPVHILSSMLPIFLMSISICDSIHVLSEFFDVYTEEKGRKESVKEVMNTLFMPMLYTSLTTAAGFFSFVTTDIPPARVFGAFVGVGVMFAWIITILFVPAYIMLLPERMLRNFGLTAQGGVRESLLTRLLHGLGEFACRRAKVVLALFGVGIVASIWGMSQITINDNYAKRFSVGHPIREADSALNRHFGGTYTASLVLEAKNGEEVFKRPDVLTYMAAMQAWLEGNGYIGKSTSLADIVRKVHQELVDGSPGNFRIPSSQGAVSECVMQYQQSHKPHDIWHFVTPEFDSANIFMQFQSGDSTRTEAAVKAIEGYIERNKPPVDLSYRFAGLHYINYIFQGKMFWGMLGSLAGSYVIVLLMMIVLFRSALWGFLCMIPLTLTILFIYGALGFFGLDYDMPVAVLGAISLGIAVDFAIHFLERSRQITSETGSWEKTAPRMFGEPARAISRNVIIIALGFLPMLVAALVPYKTTGLLLFSILTVSGLVTLVLLPALLTVGRGWFFRARRFSFPGAAGSSRDVPALALARIGAAKRDAADDAGRE
ncbi:efflux RND transporter permease subunit [Desulfolutivibrio sulfoxidireducens]|uniref:efflux RND transporter permease subunit n=1 Tax=Desulfolutivibrio sulfoxidireducens TaxID=2773299 RepID=UPI00159EA9E7|nr:MMPL family transporter [Desulfolutivibrio sulfoxidireducens]QLA19316.1 MMPL family transporter [Desulfolutivibrio sulfoxidireducens]